MDLSKARWRKSSFSGDNGGNCVEVAELTGVAAGPPHPVRAAVVGDTAHRLGRVAGAAHKMDHDRLIAVRDSKDPEGPQLFFTPAEWDAFVAGVKADEFDLA
jgi:hypothetical protein